MQPEVFYLNERHCCLIYKDYLVVNLPVDKIQERINMIDEDRCPGYWKRFWDYFLRSLFFRFDLVDNSKSFWKKLNLSYTTTNFKLDKYFRMYLVDSNLGLWRIVTLIFANTEKMVFRDQEIGSTLLQWLDKNLKARGFAEEPVVISKKIDMISGVVCLGIVLILALGVKYEWFSADMQSEIISAAIGCLILIVLLGLSYLYKRLFRKHRQKQGPVIGYRKK